MRKLLISAAAIALAASGAYAEPGNGKGNGGGNKGGGHAEMSHGNGGGNAKADRGPSMKADRGPSMKADRGSSMKADRGPSMKEAKADRGPSMKAAKADRGPSMKAAKADRGPVKAAKVDRGPQGKNGDRVVQTNYRSNGDDRDYRRDGYRDGNTSWFRDLDRDRYGYVEGCPPGLAKKNNGCMPPGLAKDRADWGNNYYRPSYFGYTGMGDGRYYYDNGYLYRTGSNGSILGYIPLLGGALSVGNQWPSYYQPTSVPQYYVDYYNLGPANSYRYADNVFYRVDPNTSAISSIAALLTGDQFAVGQRMPTGYDVYNVPYAYRDQYYDTPDSYYRFSDGYVYQVDPTTQLIQAAIQLLT